MSISSAPETTGVTSFHDEAAACATAPATEPVTSFVAGTGESQDLKEYFRRPRLIRDGTLSNSTSVLWSDNIDVSKLFDTWFPFGRDRLEGVEGVRFTMVFTATVAANPFHGGTVCLAYQYGGFTFDPDQYCRLILPASSTNLPHVRLNVAENTMVQLSIPYLADVDYMTLSTAPGRFLGAIGLTQIIPTPTLTNSAAPTYKIFVHLEDLELIGARPVSEQFVVPQSGIRTKQDTGVSNLLNELTSNKLISRGLAGASKIVANVGTMVPSLAAISGPTSWALRMASGVASVFGYSKPRDCKLPKRVYRSDYIGETNVDVPSAAFALAATAENSLRTDATLGGTTEDEMALKYVVTKYSQLCSFAMATNDTTGTRLWGTLTNLTNFWYRLGATKPFCNVAPPQQGVTANCILPTGLMYWSNFFRYWRGGLKFRFSFGKCKLHAGRVIVGFVPYPALGARNGQNNANIPALEVTSSLPQPFSYSAVFDLKDASEFEFEVPYTSPYAWTPVNGYTGGITMTVLDPLIANGECSTNIPVLVEVCAMDDFDFAVPCPNSLVPATGNTGLTLQSQSGMGVDTSRRVEEYTTGETIKSAKQLLMMPTSLIFDVADSQESVTTLPSFAYLPRWTNAIPMANPSQQWLALSRQAAISACYAYWSGSTSYDVYADAEAERFSIQAFQAPTDGNFAPGLARSVYSGGVRNNAVRITSGRNALHFQCQSYGLFPRLLTRDFYFGAARTFAPGSTALASQWAYAIPMLRIRNTTTRPVRVNLSIAGGEDARFAAYLGPPIVYLFNTAQTVSPDLSPQVI